MAGIALDLSKIPGTETKGLVLDLDSIPGVTRKGVALDLETIPLVLERPSSMGRAYLAESARAKALAEEEEEQAYRRGEVTPEQMEAQVAVQEARLARAVEAPRLPQGGTAAQAKARQEKRVREGTRRDLSGPEEERRAYAAWPLWQRGLHTVGSPIALGGAMAAASGALPVSGGLAGLFGRAGAGAWAEPLAQGVIGAGAQTGIELAAGERDPMTLAKHAALAGGAFGAIPALGLRLPIPTWLRAPGQGLVDTSAPMIQQAGRGLQIGAKALPESVVGMGGRLGEALGKARAALPAPAQAGVSATARFLGARTPGAIEDARIASEVAAANLIRDFAETHSQRAVHDLNTVLHAGQRDALIPAIEGRTGQLLAEHVEQYGFVTPSQMREFQWQAAREVNAAVAATFDRPAAAMEAAEEAARRLVSRRAAIASQAVRGTERQVAAGERAVLTKEAAEAERARLIPRKEGLFAPKEATPEELVGQMDEASEVAWDAKKALEEAQIGFGAREVELQANLEPYRPLISVLEDMAKGARPGVARFSTRWAQMVPENRLSLLGAAGIEGDLSLWSQAKWGELPAQVQKALKPHLRVTAAPVDKSKLTKVIRTVGGKDKVVGYTPGFDVKTGDAYHAAGYPDVDTFYDDVIEWVKAEGVGEVRFLHPGYQRTRDFGESTGHITATEARAALRAIYAEARAATEEGRALLVEIAAMEKEVAVAGRALSDAEARFANYFRPKPPTELERLRADLAAKQGQLTRLKETGEELRRIAGQRFPAEVMRAGQEAKQTALDTMWDDLRAQGWDEEVVAHMDRMRGIIAEGETAAGTRLAETGIFSPEAIARREGAHLRRVAPYYKSRYEVEMRDWLQRTAPEKVPDFERRLRAKARMQGMGQAPFNIRGEVFARKKVAGELPEYLGAGEVPVLERARQGQRLAQEQAAVAEGLQQMADRFAVSPERFATFSPAQMARYRQFPEGQTWGALSGQYVEQPIWNILSEWQHLPTWWDKIISRWKAFKVPMSAAATAHNSMANLLTVAIEYGVGPLSPRNIMAALKELRTGTGLWASCRDLYPLGAGGFARKEIGDVMGSFGSSRTLGGLLRAADKALVEKPARLYGDAELLSKWLAARWEILEKGVPAAKAMAHADRTILNYGQVPSAIAFLRRTGAMPFISYPFKMSTEVIPEWIARQPATLYALARSPVVLSNLSGKPEEVKLERLLLPEWYEPDLMLRLPWKDRDGASLWVDLSRILPFSDVMEASYGSLRKGIEQVRAGGVGTGFAHGGEMAAEALGPVYKGAGDVAQITRGYKPAGASGVPIPLENQSPKGKLLALAGYLGQTAAPGVMVDFVKVMTAEAPTQEAPWRKGRLLEAIRAAGIPLVRVKPDVDAPRMMERLDKQVRTSARAAMMVLFNAGFVPSRGGLPREAVEAEIAEFLKRNPGAADAYHYQYRQQTEAMHRLEELVKLGKPAATGQLPTGADVIRQLQEQDRQRREAAAMMPG